MYWSWELLLLAYLTASSHGHPSRKSGVHSIDLKRHPIRPTIHKDDVVLPVGEKHDHIFQKRNHVLGGIHNEINKLRYTTGVGVGSGWQDNTLWVDTGSYDTWFFGASACGSGNSCPYGSFDPSKSSTFHNLNKPFSINYIGASASGYYFKDQFSIGGIGLSQAQLAVATSKTNLDIGILGLNGNQGAPYRIVPQVMKDQGWTQTSAFSIWLNDERSANGNILFGGYDKARFTGPLVTLPWRSALTGLSFTNADGSTTTLQSKAFPMEAYIDTGAGNIGLPPDIWAAVANRFGVSCQYLVWCDVSYQPGSFSFRMGGTNGVTIQMPYSQIALPIFNSDGTPYQQGGRDVCTFAFQQGSMGGNFLGDPFLRNAYTIWDSDRVQVAYAQSKWNVSSSVTNIVEITPNGNLGGQATVTTIAFATPTSVKSGWCSM